MDMEIVLPNVVGVMTLSEVTFFPQALLPLHVYEPRYRQMLKDVLATHRLFAVVAADPDGEPTEEEPSHRIGTIGIVRACQKHTDGTSNLLLQGLARIECLGVVAEEPYRRVHMRALASQAGAAGDQNNRLRRTVERLIDIKRGLGAPVPREFTRFLKTVDDPETFVDLAAFTLCDDASIKQRLLETLDVHERLRLYGAHLRREISDLKLRRKLQGGLSDDAISSN